MTLQRDFLFGIVEGFFGREWSWEVRAEWAPFLREQGANLYIYAPKSQSRLRKAWREPLSADDMKALHRLRNVYRDEGVGFGVGLSPLGLHEGISVEDRELLEKKAHQLKALELDFLGVFFDDTKGDIEGLAQSQVDLTHRLVDEVRAADAAFCPTYYAEDPVLEKVFGARPADYWSCVGERLDADVRVLWTGEKVCSSEYPAAHLDEVAERFGRPVTLWDNYPVNDGQRLVDFLHLEGTPGRTAQLRDRTAGQLMNPMNQASLSKIPFATMARVYDEGASEAPGVSHAEMRALCPPALADLLVRDAAAFARVGRQLSDEERAEKTAEYAKLDHPMAQEVVAWLAGEYAFDPACLTD
jgi:hypothetical protein